MSKIEDDFSKGADSEPPSGGFTHLGKSTGGVVGYDNGRSGGRDSTGRFETGPDGRKNRIWQPS